MQPEHRSLWEQLEAYCLDDPSAAFTFSERLARENGWTANYARRVLEEYKRFVLLAATGACIVTPSEQVDQAWHLHLTFTGSYWQGMCQGLLGKPLHHDPTRGGPTERARFRVAYERTLALYRATFGHPAPVDIWPAASQRFGSDLAWQRVNTDAHWVVRKPAVLRACLRLWRERPGPLYARAWPLLLMGAAGCAAAGMSSPLDWRGPPFLGLFVVVWLTTFALAHLWRHQMRQSSAPAESLTESTLDDYDAACLAGGPKHMLHTALVHLIADEVLAYDKETERVLLRGELSETAHALERRLVARIPPDKRVAVRKLERAAATLAPETTRRLELLNLTLPPGPNWPLWLGVCAPLLGSLKLAVGLMRDRPVGLLLILCLVASVLAWRSLGSPPRLTTRGQEALEWLQLRHSELRPRSGAADERPYGTLPLAFGLFGAAILQGSSLEALAPAMQAYAWRDPSVAGQARENGGGCGDGADGGGGGGGGGGCGGCGCGG